MITSNLWLKPHGHSIPSSLSYLTDQHYLATYHSLLETFHFTTMKPHSPAFSPSLFLWVSFLFLLISSVFKCWRWLIAESSFLFNLLSSWGKFHPNQWLSILSIPTPQFISPGNNFFPWNWESLYPAAYIAASLGCLIGTLNLPCPK